MHLPFSICSFSSDEALASAEDVNLEEEDFIFCVETKPVILFGSWIPFSFVSTCVSYGFKNLLNSKTIHNAFILCYLMFIV